ncbi:MAG: hypothetical protein M3165_08670 [Actinomycetota bacterium]|nr:hypothetical protein [Actinomycetota bacterium]
MESAWTRLFAWRRRSHARAEVHRLPAAAHLVTAAIDELARDPHVREVDCNDVHVDGRDAIEVRVVPARPDCVRGATSACEQMAHLIEPLTRQEGLDVRFRLAAPS